MIPDRYFFISERRFRRQVFWIGFACVILPPILWIIYKYWDSIKTINIF